MTAMRPGAQSHPSGRTVVLAFSIAVVVALALVATAVFLATDDGASPASPVATVDLDGIPQEGTVLGNPDATVTLIEYADMQCPFCREYSEKVFPTIVDEYVRPGKVRTEFRGLAFLGPDSEKALRFVLAAGSQDRLWQLQEALFRHQGAENSGWVADDLVRELAAEIPGLDIERLYADADGADIAAMMEDAARQAQAAEVPGTPTFFIQIGDRDPYLIQVPLEAGSFRPALDDALQG